MSRRSSVEHFFSEHVEEYSRSQSHALGPDLTALITGLRPEPSEAALDVATGTGFAAVALASRVGHVVGIDLTKGMLAQAKALARDNRLANVRFELGDAMTLRYPDASFDIVTARRATHHFDSVPRFLLEAKRVLKPGGKIGIVDMAPPEGAKSFMNTIERLRDGSHVEAFAPRAWESMMTTAGFRIRFSKILDEQVTFEGWLYPVKLGGNEERAIHSAWESAPEPVRRLLKSEFEGERIRGWSKPRIVLIASKTP